MVKVILKNTFISYAPDDESESDGAEAAFPCARKASSPRSRSADGRCSSPPRDPEEDQPPEHTQIQKLNRLLSPVMSVASSPPLQPSSGRCSPNPDYYGAGPLQMEMLFSVLSPLPSGASSPKLLASEGSSNNLVEYVQRHEAGKTCLEPRPAASSSAAAPSSLPSAAFQRAAAAAAAAGSSSSPSASASAFASAFASAAGSPWPSPASAAASWSPAGSPGAQQQRQHQQQQQQRWLWDQAQHAVGGGGPSAQELKQLQRRLEEVCHSSRRSRPEDYAGGAFGLGLGGGGGQRGGGGGSISMPHATSTGSISTMAPAEDEDSGDTALQRGMPVEFDLTIEEDPPTWSATHQQSAQFGQHQQQVQQRREDIDWGTQRHPSPESLDQQARRRQPQQHQQQHQRPQHQKQQVSARYSARGPGGPGGGGGDGAGGGGRRGRDSPPQQGASSPNLWPKDSPNLGPRRGGASPPGSPGLGPSSPDAFAAAGEGPSRFFDRALDPGCEYRLAQGGQQRRPKEYRHAHVPKTVNLQEEYKQQGRDGAPTTIMIRNIPNHYTQRQLIGELDSLGFAGTFDFLYIPLDKGTMSNVGYAFVNFVEPRWAEKCMASFQNHRFKPHRKIAAVSVAHIQGLDANLAHYENAAVNTAKLKQRRPVIMANISQSLTSALLDE